MNKYALIVSNKVDLVVESESLPETPGSWVLMEGNFGPGDTYVAGVFSKTAVVEKRHITNLAFISRFTDAEAVAIDLASIGATVNAASIRRYLQKVTMAQYIDLNRADTIAGVNGLEALGIIAAGRATQILNNPVQPHEVYYASIIRH